LSNIASKDRTSVQVEYLIVLKFYSQGMIIV
jgi:hypothetical protein